MRLSLRPLISAFLLSGLVLTGCNSPSADPTIAGLAVANPDFQLLEDAAAKGGVVVLLSNKNPDDPSGNFTVFAPTNAAFARLGFRSSADLNTLQRDFLTKTLYYHVANGSLPGSSLQPGGTSVSVLGVTRRYLRRGNDVYVNGSRIVQTDVATANGPVHVVDKVLLATGADIVQSAVALSQAKVFTAPELTFLVEAVEYCGLAEALSAKSGSRPLTVFAPTDAAFRQLGQQLGVPLNQPADIRKLPRETVTAVLLNHVLAGDQFTPELPANDKAVTLGGRALTFGAFADGTLPVRGAGNNTDAQLVIADVQCTNGIVHVINQVLLP